MRRASYRRFGPIVAAIVAVVAVMAHAAPAAAGYGAVALDEKNAKYGFGWNEDTQKKADDAAMQACNGEACKIVFRVPPKQCGSLATAEKGAAWGGSVKPTRDAAKLGAIENCQKNTSGKCVVRGTDCNR